MESIKSKAKDKNTTYRDIAIVLFSFVITISFGILLDVFLLPNNIMRPIIMIEKDKYQGIITTIISLQGLLATLFFTIITLITCFYEKQLFGIKITDYLVFKESRNLNFKNSLKLEFLLLIFNCFFGLLFELINTVYFCFTISLVITLIFSLRLISAFVSDKLTENVFNYLCSNIDKENYLTEYKKWFIKSLQEDSFSPLLNIDYLGRIWAFVIKLNEEKKIDNFSEYNYTFSVMINALLKYQGNPEIQRKAILLLTSISNEYSKKEEYLQNYTFNTLFNSENINELAKIYVNEGYNDEINELRRQIRDLKIKMPAFEENISNCIIKRIAHYANENRRIIRHILLSLKILDENKIDDVKDALLFVLTLADNGAIRSIAYTLLEGNGYSKDSYPFMMICPFIIYLYYIAFYENEKRIIEYNREGLSKDEAKSILSNSKEFIRNYFFNNTNFSREIIDLLINNLRHYEIVTTNEGYRVSSIGNWIVEGLVFLLILSEQGPVENLLEHIAKDDLSHLYKQYLKNSIGLNERYLKFSNILSGKNPEKNILNAIENIIETNN